jgi:hypothetical protein
MLNGITRNRRGVGDHRVPTCAGFYINETS